MLEPKFCSYFGRFGLRLRQLRVFTKKAVICNKSCMGTIFGFWPHTTMRSRTCFFLVGVSQRPQVPREPTPNKLRTNSERTPNELRTNSEQTPDKLRTNSEQTPNELRTNSGRTRNKLRTSEQAPSELWHCSRANSEHTLAISMFLSPSILVAKLFLFAFSGLPKRPSDYRASFNKWPGKVFF